jgi:hypothetical protein
VTSNIRDQCEAPHIHFPLPPVAFDHRAPNRRENTMMTELQIFTEVASSSTFLVISAIFALAYAGLAIWLVGRKQRQNRPVLNPRRAY